MDLVGVRRQTREELESMQTFPAVRERRHGRVHFVIVGPNGEAIGAHDGLIVHTVARNNERIAASAARHDP